MPSTLQRTDTRDDATGIFDDLPASVRAQLAWFPVELRRHVVEPLRQASDAGLSEAVERAIHAAVPLLFRLSRAVVPLIADERVVDALASFDGSESKIHARVRERLEPVDPIAADQLREAWEWLGAILQAFVREMPQLFSSAALTMEPTPEAIRDELRGPSGALIRGMVLTMAAVEAVLDARELPETLARLCELGSREIQAAANILRAHGVGVPTAVIVPGVTQSAWQQRWQRHAGHFRPPTLPTAATEVLATLAPEEVWLFGSRARGTHSPRSDWDLLAVVADEAHVPTPGALPALRRRGVDLWVVTRSQFEEGKPLPGTLANIAVTQGYRVDAL